MKRNQFNPIKIDWNALPAHATAKEYAALTPITEGSIRGWACRRELKPHHYRGGKKGRPSAVFSIDSFRRVVLEYGLVHGWFGYKRCGCGAVTDTMNSGRCRKCWRRDVASSNKDKQKAKARQHKYRSKPEVKDRERAVSRRRASERRAIARGARAIYGDAIPIKKPKRAKCYWCGEKTADFHYDHIVPISKGGHHANYNIVTACAACNMSKGAKDPNEWHEGQMEIEYGRG